MRPRVLALLGASLLAAGCDRSAAPEWHEADGHRWRELRVADAEGPLFVVQDPSRTGVAFTNTLGEDSLVANEILAHGSGVALGDYDGDGRTDIYLAGVQRDNALFRNLGDWRFRDVTAEAGVGLSGRASRGAVFADVEGDGDADLLVTVHGGRDVLLANRGDGTFEERPLAASGTDTTGAAGASTTPALADVDGDGDLDLYVVRYKMKYARDLFPPEVRTSGAFERRDGRIRVRPEYSDHWRIVERDGAPQAFEYAEPDALYLNDGTGRFEPVPFTGGRFLDEEGRALRRPPDDWGLAARFQDVDGDGDPDLYVCNDFASPDRFWINDGSGRFRAVDSLALRATSAASMGVDFSDVDGDGHLDLFVGEMLSRDPARRKTQVPEMPVPSSGPDDIGRTIQVSRSTVQLGRGDGTWAEVARYAGVAATEWSWGTLFLDADLDGREDLFVTTGHVHDFLDADTRERNRTAFTGPGWRRARLLFPRLEVPNQAFRNRGGVRFDPVGEAWGFGGEPDISHGLAAGDLDGDGDADLVVNRLQSEARLYRNGSGRPRVAVRLAGGGKNRRGIGAVVRLRGGPAGVQRKEVAAGGVYLSGSEPLLTFAAGAGDGGSGGRGSDPVFRLTVAWPGGARSALDSVRPNRLYEIREPASTVGAVAETGSEGRRRVREDGSGNRGREGESGDTGREDRSDLHFEEVALEHEHRDRPFPDFRREPLLPFRPGRLGPGVAWQDLDRDGDPDLLVGTGRGGRPGLFRNDDGTLRAVRPGVPEAGYDQTTLVAVPGADGEMRVLVGQMSYEAADAREALGVVSVVGLEAAGGRSLVDGGPVRAVPVAPGARSSVGPLAAADLEGDGDLDLFVGGRLIPTLYPLPASSRIYRREGEGWVPDPESAETLRGVGMVSGAAFSDVDGDGDPDLILAVEWGSLELFLNRDGRLVEATEGWGLGGAVSRWNGVTAGDLDGDGRLDVVATSWGENGDVGADPERPLHLHYGDFDGDGSLDMLTARRPPGRTGLVPLERLSRLSRGIPSLRRRFPTRGAYAEADVSEILGAARRETRVREATTLSHTVFWNRGGRFEPSPLPREAQFAASFHAGVLDLDGDGNEDLFLTQNFYATDPETARHDAGRSLWLRGDGDGGLAPVPGQRSGIRVYGDARGAAAADFDGDGRVDLAVSQNGARTILYRNRGARPGLRVRLLGPEGNPWAVGAVLRVEYGDGGLGPAREVRAGGGYWSVDGPIPVLGLARRPAAVRVRWPGGRTVRVPVDADAREVTVRWTEPVDRSPDGSAGAP